MKLVTVCWCRPYAYLDIEQSGVYNLYIRHGLVQDSKFVEQEKLLTAIVGINGDHEVEISRSVWFEKFPPKPMAKRMLENPS